MNNGQYEQLLYSKELVSKMEESKKEIRSKIECLLQMEREVDEHIKDMIDYQKELIREIVIK